MEGDSLIPFTALIHGGPGAGKSWLVDTMPAPRLILDAEGRAHYLPSRKVWWDPTREAPPVHDGTWETCVVTCASTAVATQTFTWLRSGQHPFVSLGVDSIMEMQKRTVDEIAGLNPMRERDWGTLLRQLERMIRDFRDLTLVPATGVRVVVFTVGTREQNGKYEPLLQGQLRDTVPYYLDVTGYLYVTPDPETGAETRNLLIRPQPNYIAADHTGGRLPGPIISNPRIDGIVELLSQHTQSSTTEGGTQVG